MSRAYEIRAEIRRLRAEIEDHKRNLRNSKCAFAADPLDAQRILDLQVKTADLEDELARTESAEKPNQ